MLIDNDTMNCLFNERTIFMKSKERLAQNEVRKCSITESPRWKLKWLLLGDCYYC